MNERRFVPLEFRERPAEEMLERARAFAEEMARRRSVRAFSERPVPRELIERCIAAAGTAPSGANLQPWHFVAISDPAVKRRVREAAEREERAFYAQRATPEWLRDLEPLGTTPDKPFLETAPWLIAIFYERYRPQLDGTRRKAYYAVESVGIATGLLIAAVHLAGLVCLTHTPSPMKFLNEITGRPEHERPFLLLVVGYPAAGAEVPLLEKKSLAEIATFL